MASGAQAATIVVKNDTQYDTNPTNGTADRGDLTCTACQVIQYNPTTFSFATDFGELFRGPSNSGAASEAAWVNSVLGTSFTGANVTAGKVTPVGAGKLATFVTTALYIVLKIGENPDYTIIKNTSATGSMEWFWRGRDGQGAGLSHFVNLGTAPSTVPVPAAGFLLLGALGGLAMVRRRRKTA